MHRPGASEGRGGSAIAFGQGVEKSGRSRQKEDKQDDNDTFFPLLPYNGAFILNDARRRGISRAHHCLRESELRFLRVGSRYFILRFILD